MRSLIKTFFALTLLSGGMLTAVPKVVKLTPPLISHATISEQIVCTRPMREGKFNISAEAIGKQFVIHCYGHGGAGLTTLFGSVNKAIDQLPSLGIRKRAPIKVIGSGCMGLTTAIELKRAGYNVTGIFTKELIDLPSWKAGGYFALLSLKTNPKEQVELNKMTVETFLTYQKIESGKHPYINKDAVRYIPIYCSTDTDAGVEGLVALGLIPPAEEVTLDFGNNVLHRNFLKYMTYYIETATLMRQLTLEVKRLGIPIEKKQIRSFSDVGDPIVFNCTGLGARELNSDDKMTAVRGHLVTLNSNAGSGHMDYMIYTTVMQDGKSETISLFPKTVSVTPDHVNGVGCVGVLGGTFIPDVDKMTSSDQSRVDETEFKRLLDRNCGFFQGHYFDDCSF